VPDRRPKGLKLYSYIVVHDYGFAPNPFHGWCTLAACTPNHMGVKAKKGDWIVGFDGADYGHNLVYAMQIDAMLHFDEYHADSRFRRKIPVRGGDWRNQCGDNLYFRTPKGKWDRVRSPFHLDPELLRKDTKNPFVFISQHFFYFGREATPIPDVFRALVHARQGCKSSHDPAILQRFVDWLERTFKPGTMADPRDAHDA
jgi:hypothetical protein